MTDQRLYDLAYVLEQQLELLVSLRVELTALQNYLEERDGEFLSRFGRKKQEAGKAIGDTHSLALGRMRAIIGQLRSQ